MIATLLVVVVIVGVYLTLRPHPPKPRAKVTAVALPSASASESPSTKPEPAPSPSPTQAAATTAKKPHIVADYIPFGSARRAQMAAYSRRHYGDSSIALKPRAVVLHYTAGGTAAGAHAIFAANQPNVGELPGVVAHFIVDKDGTIYQELPTDLRGRHTIGLNQVAIGIEFVQEGGSGSTWADHQIIHREAQFQAGLRLVAWLQQKYGIADRDVLGHATANDSHFFKDLQGWKNDHTDWLANDVAVFRRNLRQLRGK